VLSNRNQPRPRPTSEPSHTYRRQADPHCGRPRGAEERKRRGSTNPTTEQNKPPKNFRVTALELPYRVVRVCLGDMGAPAYKKYDTEAWFPGFGGYRETHSNSNLTDYQARRFKIRYRDGGRTVFPHTLSATGITDRAVLAVLENHVQLDGSVRIPAALRQYLGGQELIEPKVAHKCRPSNRSSPLSVTPDHSCTRGRDIEMGSMSSTVPTPRSRNPLT
jgi:tRNA synthetase class II core domain (G, H, P, S and T)